MRELLTVNYIQKEATKQNEDIVNLQPKNTYKTNQKLNSNRTKDNHPSWREIGMMGIGRLGKNNICNT